MSRYCWELNSDVDLMSVSLGQGLPSAGHWQQAFFSSFDYWQLLGNVNCYASQGAPPSSQLQVILKNTLKSRNTLGIKESFRLTFPKVFNAAKTGINNSYKVTGEQEENNIL